MHLRHALVSFAAVAALQGCTAKDKDSEGTEAPALDLTAPLGEGEVRGGRVVDDQSLFGGVSAEGQVGDWLLYNRVAKFVVQDIKDSGYYVNQGGMIIDLDAVRPEGQPGRDRVDELGVMFGLGRIIDPQSITVISDGSDGEAVVQVRGVEAPLALLEGALESTSFVENLGLELINEYRLKADSPLLEIRSTVTATEDPVSLSISDLMFGGVEASELWAQHTGLQYDSQDRLWVGYLGKTNDGAVGIFAAPGQALVAGGADFISDLAASAIGNSPVIDVAAGESVTITRYYGAGNDFAELTDAWLALEGKPTEEVTGTVTAPDGPVAGARVHVLVDDEPFTVAFSKADGSFSAKVPQGADHKAIAEGRGPGYQPDFPAGYGPVSPYGAPAAVALTRKALKEGAPEIPLAVGRGVGTDEAPLSLGEPAHLIVDSGDGLPFEVRLAFTGPDAPVDGRLVTGRASGYAAVGWAKDGTVDLAVEPGDYTLIAHRGIRYEAVSVPVTVSAGQITTQSVALTQAYEAGDYLLADPHVHASPSSDAETTMEIRALQMAAVGIQLHFGTDHDGVADYNPTLEDLGIDDVMRSVVADEVSSVIRGHINAYPLKVAENKANHGAYRWWLHPPADTQTYYEAIRANHEGPILLQANHPMSSGLASAADWSPGEIGKPTHFTTGFDAVEVINAGGIEALPFYLDCVHHGVVPTPTGVSDSHGPLTGKPGLSATFIHFGGDTLDRYSDDALRAAYAAHATVVTRGPFLEASVVPGQTVAPGTPVTVTSRSPSWIKVDRLKLLKDGVVVETITGTTATFTLTAEADAAYVVIAEGDQDLSPVWPGTTPWAMTAAWLVDVGGDGWTAPGGAF